MTSRNEEQLMALLNDTVTDVEIISRVDEYLSACCEGCGCEDLPDPITRKDKLLYQLAAKLEDGGGVGGNKLPVILGGEAINLTASDLEGVTQLRDAAFEYYYGLQSIVIPSSCASIGTACFSWCTALTEITLPSGLTSLPTNIFNECHNLETVNVPSTVTTIGQLAFNNAGTSGDGITLTMECENPPAVSDNTFTGSNIISIKVPTGTGDAYKQADGWSAYSTIIIEV